MKIEPIESTPGKFNQRRGTQEYPHPDSKFQRELNKTIREATEKFKYSPRPSTNVGWENNDGLD